MNNDMLLFSLSFPGLSTLPTMGILILQCAKIAVFFVINTSSEKQSFQIYL